MKILIVHNFYQQPGGEDAVVRQEIGLLEEKGHDILLFSVHNDAIYGFVRKAITALLAIYNPWSKRRLSKAIKKFRPDIVHVHNFFPLLSPSIFYACRAAGIPTVMTLHNFRILCPTSFLYHEDGLRERSLKHSAMWTVKHGTFHGSIIGTFFVALMVDIHKWLGTWNTKVDCLVALTPFARAKFIEGNIQPERIAVKGNFLMDLSEAVSVNDERNGALFVGRLSTEKGIQVLLDAWESIDYPLRIAGDGPLRGLCERSRNKHITYLGQLDRDHVHAEMARAAFLVLPSLWYEMFPVTVLEAFANGLPIITNQLGGLGDLVEDQVTGITVDEMNTVVLREAVLWAISHPREMRGMGKCARAHYVASYTADQGYGDLLRVYEDTIRLNHDAQKV